MPMLRWWSVSIEFFLLCLNSLVLAVFRSENNNKNEFTCLFCWFYLLFCCWIFRFKWKILHIHEYYTKRNEHWTHKWTIKPHKKLRNLFSIQILFNLFWFTLMITFSSFRSVNKFFVHSLWKKKDVVGFFPRWKFHLFKIIYDCRWSNYRDFIFYFKKHTENGSNNNKTEAGGTIAYVISNSFFALNNILSLSLSFWFALSHYDSMWWNNVVRSGNYACRMT